MFPTHFASIATLYAALTGREAVPVRAVELTRPGLGLGALALALTLTHTLTLTLTLTRRLPATDDLLPTTIDRPQTTHQPHPNPGANPKQARATRIRSRPWATWPSACTSRGGWARR